MSRPGRTAGPALALPQIPAMFRDRGILAVPSLTRLARLAATRRLLPALTLGGALGLAACSDGGSGAIDARVGGSAEAGAAHIATFGCGGCHTIPGIPGARGLVGPPLNMMGRRVYVAGLLRNTPDNMVRWITDPQAIVPGNAMPDMDISAAQARDITAYLYTLR